MSDGPHRSLPLAATWKRTAECAANPAFAVGDVGLEMMAAVEREFSETAVNALRAAFLPGDQVQLLLGDMTERLDAIRRADPGSLGTISLVECAKEAAAISSNSAIAFENAAEAAAAEVIAANRLCIEEHYLREAGFDGAAFIRNRLDEAVRSCDLRAFAERLRVVPRGGSASIAKRTGLDDGPERPR